MNKTKQDKIVILDKETGITSHIFDVTEQDEADKTLKNLIENDFNCGFRKKREMKIINAYWYNGYPSQRRK